MKRLIYLIALVAIPAVTQAQIHAHVYRDSIFMQLKGYTEKNKALDSIKQVYANEIQAEQVKAQEKYLALAKPYQVKDKETVEQLKSRMSTSDAEKLSFIQEEFKFIETRIKSYNKQLDELYKNDIQPYITNVDNAIATYAAKNKIDYVWIMEELSGKMAYINMKNNITSTIVLLVNKQ